LKSLRWAAILAAGALLPRAAGLVPRAVELLYGQTVFPGLAAVLALFGRLTRISLAQILILLAIAIILRVGIGGAVRAAQLRSLRRGFGPGHRYIAAAAVVVWAFSLLWGFNYARPPLKEKLNLPRTRPDAENLARLTRVLAAETNRAYRTAVSSGQIALPGEVGASRLRLSRDDVADRLASGYRVLLPSIGRLSLSAPKYPALAGWILTRVGISGFYFPFTGEATVDRALPDASIPFVAAHEMAHQRGAAREDEASFLAYLACRESGLAAAHYSGALEAFGLAWQSLWRASPDSGRAMQGRLLEDGPRADREAIRSFWQRHEGKASAISDRVNDLYLKANAQRAGSASYGLAVELLVALEAAGGLAEEE
jgi:hypothetical protein